MARLPTPGLLERLVDAALAAFIAAGYQRARVSEIAKAARIAPGTVYLYVEGKQALFELALRRAFRVPGALEVELPYRTSDSSTQIAEIWLRLAETRPLEQLEAAERVESPEDPGAEFEALIAGLYGWHARYWRGIALIEACARDWPELYRLVYRELRPVAIELGARHLERRAASGHYRSYPDARTAAHLIMENISVFTLARHTAPGNEHITDDLAERTVVEALGHAFVPTWADRRPLAGP